MGLSGSLFSAVSGLQIHQRMLDVVGNNLANANTTGYKGETVRFQDLIYQTIESGTAGPQGGGTNPQQVGFGAAIGSIAADFQQGGVQPTGRTLDLAIQGSGFFVVNDGTRNLFTRSGAFDLDQQGYIIDAGTGFRVQRTGTLGEGTATTPAFQIPGDNRIQVPLGFGIAGQETTSVTLRGNLSASLTTGDTFSTSSPIYDTQGSEHPLSLTFTKIGNNTFDLTASVVGGTVTGVPVTGITFNADGTLAGPASATLSVAFPPALPAAQPITINFGTINQANGISQFGGGSTLAAIDQDGFASGALVGFNVDGSGILQGIFSNGSNLSLGQIALARFANEAGLAREGQNLFSTTSASGDARVGTAQSAGLGTIQGGALEGSNVDVSAEFTRLIIAQRGFQINARTVSVSNDILQELANLIR